MLDVPRQTPSAEALQEGGLARDDDMPDVPRHTPTAEALQEGGLARDDDMLDVPRQTPGAAAQAARPKRRPRRTHLSSM